MTMATIMAWEPYFFWVWLTDSILRIVVIPSSIFGDVDNLTINRNAAADDSQHNEDYDEKSLCTQPLVQVKSDEKTENNAAGHGQADL